MNNGELLFLLGKLWKNPNLGRGTILERQFEKKNLIVLGAAHHDNVEISIMNLKTLSKLFISNQRKKKKTRVFSFAGDLIQFLLLRFTNSILYVLCEIVSLSYDS